MMSWQDMNWLKRRCRIDGYPENLKREDARFHDNVELAVSNPLKYRGIDRSVGVAETAECGASVDL